MPEGTRRPCPCPTPWTAPTPLLRPGSVCRAAPDKTHGHDKGEIVAAVDGKHGWFWRSRGPVPATNKLRSNGEYADLDKVMWLGPIGCRPVGGQPGRVANGVWALAQAASA